MKLRPPRRLGATRFGRATIATAVAVVASASVVAVAAQPASAAAGCSVAYSITTQWNVGFGTNITITNLGAPNTSWTLGWTFGGNQQITEI